MIVARYGAAEPTLLDGVFGLPLKIAFAGAGVLALGALFLWVRR